MERKPWQDNGGRRRYEDRGERSDDRRSRFDRFDRFDREDRFDDRRPRFDRDREDRFGRFDRFDRAERFGRDDRFGRGDRAKPHARGDRRPEGRGFGGRDARRDFGVRSGPRARAFETRRYAERSDFAKNAVVRIDADLADFFGSPEAVNKALRALVEAARCVKFPQPKPEAPAEAVAPEEAAEIFAGNLEEDDVETASYGQAAEEGEAAESAEAVPEGKPEA